LPIPLEQRIAQFGKARIFYETSGNGPAVVLLHGLSGSSRWWRKNTSILAERFRVYAIDLIGFGRSRGQRFVLEATAGLILAWMEQTGEDCFHLVGHSMGGLVAAELAAQNPGRVGQLVLVDVAAVPRGRTVTGSILRLFPALAFMPADFLPVLLTDALRAGPLTLLRATYAIHQAHLAADLSQVANRTLIVWGEHDMLLPVSRGRELQEALPGSRFSVLRGAGHNPMWDRAEEFNRLVTSFLLEGTE
jgi:pimeloyl-ACP methyl ester carboxylesterase